MTAGAREHREIIDLLADDRVNAAEDLLRQHVAQQGLRHPVSVVPPDLAAFVRQQGDVPSPKPADLAGAFSPLQGSDDPAVTFAHLARACVPAFADACQVELGDGTQTLFRVSFPASPADGPGVAEARVAGSAACPLPVLLTPFMVASRTGYPSYAGVMTHSWNGRGPTDGEVVIADLMVKHAVALVDRERLMAAVSHAEDRAASLALQAISGRAISLATGIVMHQLGLSREGAEEVLRQAARTAGSSLSAIAASVAHSGMLSPPRPPGDDGTPRR